ncbi:uncharacterized protein LOC116916364 isoform X2 [Daphnia magna]|uniref:uncharacterized protein LOC116916364 isoform X2 n=1 Tax=Daphnia magna TaxID=35525 RepID=UPI001E1BBDF5|nr:uncharacterized protein LOC116916364 isoform X2 [Daphnia magna]
MAIGKALICCYLVFASILVGWTAGQKRTKVGTSIAGSEIEMAPDFECPEEFGYYPAPYDCTRYYVCVFGGALLESCTGGLVYSHELQTCDWPRNVGCLTGAEAMAINAHKTSSRTSTTDSKSNSPLTQFLSSDSNKPTTSRSQSSTAAINARSKTPLTFELLGDVAATIDNRQGRDFQGTTPLRSQGPNAPIGGTSKNTLAGESPKPSSFNSRSQAPRAEDLPEDFIAATTFNPTVRIPHSRSMAFRREQHPDERMISHRHDEVDYDYTYYDDEDDTKTSSTGFTVFNHNSDRDGNVNARMRGKHADSDDELFWNPNHGSQQPKRQRFREESIPSMHFTPINSNSQRTVFEHLNHGPVPVRGAQLHSASHDLSPAVESRHFIHQSPTNSRQFQTVQRPFDSQFNGQSSNVGQFQQQVRAPEVQADFSTGLHQQSSPHSVVPLLFRKQQTQPQQQKQHQPFTEPQIPFTAFAKQQPNTRLPNTNRPLLTALPTNPIITDDYDAPNDEQQSPTLDWNEQQQPQRQAQQTLRQPPLRTPVDSRVPTGASLSSNDQFHRETTGTRQPTTESSSNGDSTDQWEAPVPQRGQRPSAPPRQSSQTERTVSTTTTERPTRPPVQTTHQFSEPDVDYHGFPVDEFATSEPTVDQFADYDIFEDPATTGGRPQEEEFLPPVTRAVPTTTTTTSTTTTTTTTTTTPKPVQRGSNRGKPAGDRGSSRFRPSDSNREEESAPASATVPKRRPTLKPVSDLVRNPVAEPIDIMQHPPRRLEPIFPQPTPDEPAARCNADVCRLPDCNCGGKDIPGGLRVNDTPQIVLLTFDDSVNDLNKKLFSDFFEKGRLNPNGCPISATFYVSHEWTDYGQVQNLYADGHEIASHTISHSFGEQMSAKKWAKEAAGQRDIMAAYGGVRAEDIRGLRAPFLSVGGNRMFKMLYDLNFTYDSSMPVYENKPPSWPYTLDYKIFHDCMIPPCPTKSYPGVWEVPMVMWQDLNGGRCSMGDGCSNPPDAEGVYKMLIKNFERHYTTNRAPFPLYYHAAWFTTAHHKEGFEAFLDTIVSMDDVWLVTNWQAIQWVRDPTPLDRIKSFKPFNCDYPERPKRCNASKVCNAWHKSGVRYMRTCQPCPEVFPWTGKTGVRNPFLDNYGDNEVATA